MTTIDPAIVPEVARPLLKKGLREREAAEVANIEAAARKAVAERSIGGREAAQRAQHLLEAAEGYTEAMVRARYLAGEHLRNLWPQAPGEAWQAAMDAEESRRRAKADAYRRIADIYLDALTLG